MWTHFVKKFPSNTDLINGHLVILANTISSHPQRSKFKIKVASVAGKCDSQSRDLTWAVKPATNHPSYQAAGIFINIKYHPYNIDT